MSARLPAWARGRLMAFDTETTGTDPEEARIVSAAVLFLGGTFPSAEHSWLIDPGVEIPEAAAAIHGISTERARAEGREPGAAIAEIVDTLAKGIRNGLALVIYNAPYDMTLLDREAERYGVSVALEQALVVDPLVIDKAIDPYRKGSRKLVDVASAYGIEAEAAHTANGDALMAARLAVKLSSRPAVAALSLEELHAAQVGWRADQAASFEAYLAKQNRPEAISREWPILPRTLFGSAL